MIAEARGVAAGDGGPVSANGRGRMAAGRSRTAREPQPSQVPAHRPIAADRDGLVCRWPIGPVGTAPAARRWPRGPPDGRRRAGPSRSGRAGIGVMDTAVLHRQRRKTNVAIRVYSRIPDADFAPKGPNRSAQGNALGPGRHTDANPERAGHGSGDVSPRSGLRYRHRTRSQGVALG